MNTKQKSPVLLRVISTIFLLLWMGLIFYFSHQTAIESDNISDGLISLIVKFLMPGASDLTVTNIVENLSFIVRKGAHFSLFAVLGFFSFLSVITYEKLHITLRVIISFLIGALYAVSDEYHQTFVVGRSGELRDVLIDSSGVLLAVLVCLGVYSMHRYIKSKRKPNMRKKQYIELTQTLSSELHKARIEIDELKETNLQFEKKNQELYEQLCIANSKLEELKKTAEAPDVTEPVEEDSDFCKEEADTAELTEPEKETVVTLSDDTAFGAKIIGKIVLSAAECCNSLTAPPVSQNAKELVNLILGRSEVAKAEILKIVAADVSQENKIHAIENELKECEDYFKSVMAQK